MLISGFLKFYVLHLNYENFKLYLQNTLNMLRTARVYFGVLHMEHDTSPNLSGVVHVHLLYVVVAHKSKMEVSPGVAQTGARLALDDATQQSRNI